MQRVQSRRADPRAMKWRHQFHHQWIRRLPLALKAQGWQRHLGRDALFPNDQYRHEGSQVDL